MKLELDDEKEKVKKGKGCLLNVPEAAEILRLSKFTVRLFIARGELPIIKLGRRVLIDSEDLNKFIAERRKVQGIWQSKKLRELI